MSTSITGWLTNPVNWSGPDGIPAQTLVHLELSGMALAIALVIGVPVGLLIGHTGRGAFLIGGLANALRALPTLGVLMIAVLLITPHIASDLAFTIPSLIVLVLLAVPPILTNTYAGVFAVDAAAVDAARGMGWRSRDILLRVQLPCALPLILSGIRAAALQIIATATVAAYVSLGGLGRFLIDGLAQSDYAQMAGGAILVAALALAVELLLLGLARLLVSPGLTRGVSRRISPPAVPASATATATAQ
ncbi:ABC transporter permease subunit [Streptomyces sp. NPDC001868]|uniref:ABC transporter permease n=1 Tax=Streptomyces sp. NPDC001868 TaxID=3154401 RepID=UPI00332FB5BB